MKLTPNNMKVYILKFLYCRYIVTSYPYRFRFFWIFAATIAFSAVYKHTVLGYSGIGSNSERLRRTYTYRLRFSALP